MQKSLSFNKVNIANKAHLNHVQTEELIADMRSIQTPSATCRRETTACAGSAER